VIDRLGETMKDKRDGNGGNGAALLGGLAISALVAGYTLMLIWGVDVCSGEKVNAELLAISRVGCMEYWLERYQTLFTGILSAIIAVGAAYLVLKTLDRMDRQNRLAEQAMQVAHDQLKAVHRKEIGIALNALAFVRSHILTMITSMDEANGDEEKIAMAYVEALTAIKDPLNEFRLAMHAITQSEAAERDVTNFERHFNAVMRYFGAKQSASYQTLMPPPPGGLTVSSLQEVREFLMRACADLGSLRDELRITRRAFNK
jgi:uncharacterized iron-regulated membrane protein